MPAPVTFAIAPYGADLGALAARAAAEKHEVLLQAPMEPFDYPNNDPGPQTLLTSLTPDQNIDRLQWMMSRFAGYVGIVGYMGARFTASEQALSPVLRETAKRGLIYVDDGASARSVAAQIAGSQNMPFVKTDIVLDAVLDAAGDRPRAGAARNGGTRARQRRRHRQRAAGNHRPHRRVGKGRRRPRLRAGAGDHGGGEGEVIVTSLSRAIEAHGNDGTCRCLPTNSFPIVLAPG